MLSGSVDPKICVGQRFQVDALGQGGDKGWIRFVGKGVSPKQPNAIYVGVEWDDDIRGKHDGAIDGNRFFYCSQRGRYILDSPASTQTNPGVGSTSPITRGAFVHPSRIKPGVSLIEALEDRFSYEPSSSPEGDLKTSSTASGDGSTSPNSTEGGISTSLLALTAAVRGEQLDLPVAFVGANKILRRLNRLEQLPHISLGGCGVMSLHSSPSSPPTPSSSSLKPWVTLESKFPACRNVILDDNLLYSHNQIILALVALPKLLQLSASNNFLLDDYVDKDSITETTSPASPGESNQIDLEGKQGRIARLVGADDEAVTRLGLSYLPQSTQSKEKQFAYTPLKGYHTHWVTERKQSPTLDESGEKIMEGEGKQAVSTETTLNSTQDVLPCPSGLRGLSAQPHALQVLVLNNVPKAWEHVLELACTGGFLDNLRELHLCRNKMSTLGTSWSPTYYGYDPLSLSPLHPVTSDDAPQTHTVYSSGPYFFSCFPKLELLNLSENALSSWSDIHRLSRLPKLTRLLLNNNAISSIIPFDPAVDALYPPSTSHAEPPFPSLAWLSITGNKLSHIATIAALSARLSSQLSIVQGSSQTHPPAFPKLVELRCSDNELRYSTCLSDYRLQAEEQRRRLSSSSGTKDTTKTSQNTDNGSGAGRSQDEHAGDQQQAATRARWSVISLLPQLLFVNLCTISTRERLNACKNVLGETWASFVAARPTEARQDHKRIWEARRNTFAEEKGNQESDSTTFSSFLRSLNICREMPHWLVACPDIDAAVEVVGEFRDTQETATVKKAPTRKGILELKLRCHVVEQGKSEVKVEEIGDSETPIVQKKVPVTMKVADVSTLCRRLFRAEIELKGIQGDTLILKYVERRPGESDWVIDLSDPYQSLFDAGVRDAGTVVAIFND